jgi:tRNA(fMet)-specific endonuclease VapC
MRSIVLDTNAYAKYLRSNEQVLRWLARADIVYVPSIVVGELFAGFKGGSRERENRQMLEQFLDKPTVEIIDVTAETAEWFEHLKHLLKKAGTALPMNDLWIAACAFETGSILVTFDAHFSVIAGIRLWDIV